MSKEISSEKVLRANHLKKYFTSGYGKRKETTHAVDDVSFEICPGETIGLIGSSGCGKTTTGRSIIKLYNITGGKIYFDGNLIKEVLIDTVLLALWRRIPMHLWLPH